MNRRSDQRAADIFAAIDRALGYRSALTSSDGALADMAYDAILRNLAVIGEAVRALPSELRDERPDIAWASIIGMRNIVVHEYFRVEKAVVLDILENDLAHLRAAIEALVKN